MKINESIVLKARSLTTKLLRTGSPEETARLLELGLFSSTFRQLAALETTEVTTGALQRLRDSCSHTYQSQQQRSSFRLYVFLPAMQDELEQVALLASLLFDAAVRLYEGSVSTLDTADLDAWLALRLPVVAHTVASEFFEGYSSHAGVFSAETWKSKACYSFMPLQRMVL